MAGTPARSSRMIEGINVTPLVDITLVLLVIFIVTAKMVIQQGTPLDLPQAAHSDAIDVVFAVAIEADGSIRVDGDPVELAAVDARTRAALQRNPETRGVIEAHRDVPHGRVMAVMDALRGAGMHRIAFATEPPPPSPAP